MDLEKLISECIAKKKGNQEFALFFFGEGEGEPWLAEIGNPSSHVMLGETEAEFSATGDNPVEALENLLLAIR